MFIVAPAVAIGSSFVGSVLAPTYDLAPGQMTIAVQSLFLGVVWAGRRVAGWRAARGRGDSRGLSSSSPFVENRR